MGWHCPNYTPFGRQHRAIVEIRDGRPVIVGCLECNWEDILFDDFELEADVVDRIDRPTRCVALTKARQRCKLPSEPDGRCEKHRDESALWERRYRTLRESWRSVTLPELYREVFIRAIRDADLVANERQVTRETFEQARRLRHASVVYFVEREGYVKIGTTTSLKQRLPNLADGSCLMPDGVSRGPVTLLATTLGDRETESAYHRRFQRQRVRGEWFRPNKALLNLIEDLQRAERRGRPDMLDEALKAA
ncbi:GIY-YIG nuclease family protein [Streptomyces sp. NPDC090741]|uniref:GIY-YIG nuclease family protein n=1 Tax=Streptomyces sp. NPDC090741 TaxID=3365967 RepID=UPI00381970AC